MGRGACANVGSFLDLRKYQFMEVNQQKRIAGFKINIPDIQKTLDTVRFLKTRKVCWMWGGAEEGAREAGTDLLLQEGSDPIQATFELNDTLYAKANIPATREVYLWLGVCLPSRTECSDFALT